MTREALILGICIDTVHSCKRKCTIGIKFVIIYKRESTGDETERAAHQAFVLGCGECRLKLNSFAVHIGCSCGVAKYTCVDGISTGMSMENTKSVRSSRKTIK